jgi:hypothetical protein
VKKTLTLAAIAATLAVGGVAVTAGTASAAIVCNAAGDCWHVDRHRAYPHVRLQVHPDTWYFHQKWDSDKTHRWHEHHDDSGYYENGVWVHR